MTTIGKKPVVFIFAQDSREHQDAKFQAMQIAELNFYRDHYAKVAKIVERIGEAKPGELFCINLGPHRSVKFEIAEPSLEI